MPALNGREGGRGIRPDSIDPIYDSAESKSRYEAYSRLQASAVAFGEKLPIPEIVAIGGQSDGKSSLLEALLGFRFNIREVEMGTRRPLMLQMVHDPLAMEPRCRLQDEHSDDYGPPIEPPSAVAEAIKARTEAHLKQLGGGAAVSAKPIVMRAEYAYCPNLTIIDSPGFVLSARKGEPESTPESIMSMVKDLSAPPHRLILFLQQSTTEWCSSLWMDVVREVDPNLRRTVVVASKFDNRIKEFQERWEVDRYLSAAGFLGDSAKPFFVALPKERNITSNSDFRRQIASVDADIMQQLTQGVAGGFDEDRFGPQIGFGNLRRFLETELQKRYRDAAPATLALLEKRCGEVDSELRVAEVRLATVADVKGLRRAAMMHTAALASHMVALLDGASDPDPTEWGRSSEEERDESAVGRWPGVSVDVKPANGSLRLYGGAAFERVLDEFRCAACSLECPPVSREKVANILLAHAGRYGGAALAAAEIARASAKLWLGPLLDSVCDRLAHVLRALFDLALERKRMQEERQQASPDSAATLSSFVAFHAALRHGHDKFLLSLTAKCRQLAHHHLDSATSPYSPIYGWEQGSIGEGSSGAEGSPDATLSSLLSTLGGSRGGAELNMEATTPATEDGRESQMTVPETPSPEQASVDLAAKRKEFGAASGRLGMVGASRQMNGDGGLKQRRNNGKGGGKEGGGKSAYSEVCAMVQEQFAHIRQVVVYRMLPSALSSGYLSPCRDELATAVSIELFACTDTHFMDMFVAPGAMEALEQSRATLQRRRDTLTACLTEFRSLARSL